MDTTPATKLDESDHYIKFIPELAARIGLNEAIVIGLLNFWISRNETAGINSKEGFTWTYNSANKWKEHLPFWSINTIRRTFSSLEAKNLIVSSNHNKSRFDQTKWYRIDYDAVNKILENPSKIRFTQIGQMDNAKMGKPIPKTTKVFNSRKRVLSEQEAAAKKEALQERLEDAEFKSMKRIEQEAALIN